MSKKSTLNTYNIGSFEKSITIFKLAKIISNLFDKKISLIKSRTEIGSPKDRQPDMTEFKKLINYNQNYDLKSGLKITYEF